MCNIRVTLFHVRLEQYNTIGGKHWENLLVPYNKNAQPGGPYVEGR